MTRDELIEEIADNSEFDNTREYILTAVDLYCANLISEILAGIRSFYNYPTIIESFNGKYRVVGQDGSLPAPLFYGSYDECVKWRTENCR